MQHSRIDIGRPWWQSAFITGSLEAQCGDGPHRATPSAKAGLVSARMVAIANRAEWLLTPSRYAPPCFSVKSVVRAGDGTGLATAR
jgi:hypothetical protein